MSIISHIYHNGNPQIKKEGITRQQSFDIQDRDQFHTLIYCMIRNSDQVFKYRVEMRNLIPGTRSNFVHFHAGFGEISAE